MALVIRTDIPYALRVKNLGWLLKNWRDVEQFHLLPFEDGNRFYDGILVANMRDGLTSYVTCFASFDVAREWLHRPVFRGLPLNDCGTIATC